MGEVKEEQVLRILHLEDDPLDSEMARRLLHQEGLETRIDRVYSLESFRQRLESAAYALILSDYTLPGVNALEALHLARRVCPQTPYIFLSGMLGEDVAIEMLKMGATDYVLKQRMERLGPAVRRALHEAEEQARRKQTEKALRESEDRVRASEAKFRAVFEKAAIGMGRVNFADARWTDVNDAFCDMLGYSREEMLSMPWPQMTHPEDVELDLVPFRQMAAGELENYTVEKRFIHKQGGHVWSRLRLSLVRDAEGRPDYEIAIIEDISERKRAEDALRRSEERLRSVLENSLDAAYRRDLRTDTYDYLSPVMEQVMGVSLDKMQSLSVEGLIERIHPEDRERVQAAIEEGLRSGKGRVEYRFLTSGGQYRWLADHFTVQVDGRGAPLFRGGTVRDVTEQKQAETALRQANAALGEADRRKDEFLAMLAHELRNPLAPIRYAVQMMQLSSNGSAAEQRQREVIDRQVSHMGRLLDDLLDVSRITRGKIQLRKERLDLRQVVGQAAESMRSQIDSHGLKLALQTTSAPLMVEGDPTRLEQVVRNLLHNAIKYTEQGGCIWMTAGLEAEGEHDWSAVVRVRDSGIGIAPEMLGRVFELFTQVEHTLDRSQGGLGIGLTMVKRLVEMHRGAVEAHSDGMGRGSEFVVRLPLVEAALQENIGEGQDRRESGRNRPERSRRVLVVEDNEDAAASLSELLGLWGHEVRAVHDGLRALSAARQFRPEVVLLDIGLPGMDGYTVAQRLRDEPETAQACVVALTGYGSEEDRRRAKEAGFDHHLTKPVELERLQSILKDACAA